MSLKVSHAFVSRGDLVERVECVASSIYFMWYLADFPRKISASFQLSRLPVYSKVTHCIHLGWLSALTGDDELNFTRFALSSTKLLILVLMAARWGEVYSLVRQWCIRVITGWNLTTVGSTSVVLWRCFYWFYFFLHWYKFQLRGVRTTCVTHICRPKAELLVSLLCMYPCDNKESVMLRQ